jgi:hypothetical protein
VQGNLSHHPRALSAIGVGEVHFMRASRARFKRGVNLDGAALLALELRGGSCLHD